MSKRTVIERELRAIWDARGQLTAGDVLDVATDPAHPLHGEFEWDDTEAATQYRLTQARNLIRSVKVRITTERAGEEQEFQIRGYLSAWVAGAEAPSGAYLPEEQIRHDPALRNVLLQQMRRDVNAVRRRYQQYAEFWALIAEINGTTGNGEDGTAQAS